MRNYITENTLQAFYKHRGSRMPFDDHHNGVSDPDRPRPLELISVEDSEEISEAGEVVQNKSLKLNMQNLEYVMRQVDVGLPVAIISVVGAFRSGKSFLLSFFLKILESEQAGESLRGSLGGKSGSKGGFSWKGGIKGHTQGMMVWSRPFIREVNDGKGGRTKTAVLLVDTQGTFDHNMDRQLEACLFGLSTTLSSCQIFNVKNQVQVDTLGSLAVLLEYGDVGKETFSETTSTNDGGGGENVGGAPFQRLEFLIRDSECWETPTESTEVPCKRLRKRFCKYLHDILGNSTSDNIKINGCFEDDIGCFGLPHPGRHVTSLSFDGNIEDIDPGFRRLLTYYLTHVILGELKATSPSVLPNTGAGAFTSSFERWVKLFSDGAMNGQLPKADSWQGAKHDSHNLTLAMETLRIFREAMDEEATNDYIDATELETILKKHKEKALKMFQPRGEKRKKLEAEEKLMCELNKEAARIKTANERLQPTHFWSNLGIGAAVATMSAEVAGNIFYVAAYGAATWAEVAFFPVVSSVAVAGIAGLLVYRMFPGSVATAGKFLRNWFSSPQEPEESDVVNVAVAPEGERTLAEGEESGTSLPLPSREWRKAFLPLLLWAIFAAVLLVLLVWEGTAHARTAV